jgi:hypothetical protein
MMGNLGSLENFLWQACYENHGFVHFIYEIHNQLNKSSVIYYCIYEILNHAKEQLYPETLVLLASLATHFASCKNWELTLDFTG